MTNKIVVIAENEELKLVEKLGYSNYPIIVTGVGAINVIKKLNNIPRETEIINIGYAGSKNYDIGTIVGIKRVATQREIANFKEEYNILQLLPNVDCYSTCYTSTDFIVKTNKKEDCVFDMELAIISSLFPNTRAIKVVSDNLSIKQYKRESKND